MGHPIEELEKIAERVQTTLGSTPQLCALFKYLWAEQEAHVGHRAIWETGGLKALCRSKDKDAKNFDFAPNVRQAVLDLRKALKSYFRRHPTESWRIELPNADQGRGYRLECSRVANGVTVTGAFWGPHLQGVHSVSVVHVEQLFYYDREQGLVFRYYDCNEEHGPVALSELHHQHGDIYPEPPRGQSDRLKPVYPYVAKGEALAIQLLDKWFADHGAVKINPATTRNLHHDDLVEEDSLILFGSAPSNRFIRALLDRHQDAPMTLENRSRVRLLATTSAERETISELVKAGCCTVDCEGDDCILEFEADKSWPGILMRLPNFQDSRTATTVFNSDYGTAIHALTDFVTDEDRLRKGLQLLGIDQRKLGEYFQFLYCVDAVRHDKKPRIHAIAWRQYKPTGI